MSKEEKKEKEAEIEDAEQEEQKYNNKQVNKKIKTEVSGKERDWCECDCNWQDAVRWWYDVMNEDCWILQKVVENWCKNRTNKKIN